MRRLIYACCASWLTWVPILDAAPSVREESRTFLIEETEEPASVDFLRQAFVVSKTDQSQREKLGAPLENQPASYAISPDEHWIYRSIHVSRNVESCALYHQQSETKFASVFTSEAQFPVQLWKFFSSSTGTSNRWKESAKDGTGIIDFVNWSQDSARLLVRLRGPWNGDEKKWFVGWCAYFNLRFQRFELTDYLRAVNSQVMAPNNLGQNPAIQTEALGLVCAEPIDDLGSLDEMKERADRADETLNIHYQKLANALHGKDRQIFQNEQKQWAMSRDAEKKRFASFGGKPEKRNLIYQLESALTRNDQIEDRIETLPKGGGTPTE